MSDDRKRIDSEVDDQLAYLFAATGEEDAGAEAGQQPDPLRELKAIFLAVDWEINDDIMAAMLRQIEALKEAFADDRVMMLFLQLLEAVGKYVKGRKANAHPDAVKLLNSIYTSMEIVSMSAGMTEAERKKILRTEVKRFQALKGELVRKKARSETGPAQDTPEPPGEEIPAALRYVLEQIRKTIRDEFKALRTELKS